MPSSSVQRRDKKAYDAAVLALALVIAPELVLGKGKTTIHGEPITPQTATEFGAARYGCTANQTNRALQYVGVKLQQYKTEAKHLGKTPQERLVAALRRGATLTAARRISGLSKAEVDAAWLRAERGEEDELGHSMLAAVGLADLDAQADYRKTETRSRQHEAGAWTPSAQRVDKEQAWNLHLDNIVVSDSQLSLAELESYQDGEKK